jgi:rubrerythrin
MTVEDTFIKELEMMARHEEVIGELYGEYARNMPEYADFWQRLAGEEAGHAAWIRKLFTEVKNGTVTFKESRFNVKAIETSMRYVKGWIVQAKSEALDPMQALSMARDIETSLIEKNYLASYEADSPEMKKVLNALKDSTTQHRERLNQMIIQAKGGTSPIVPIG